MKKLIWILPALLLGAGVVGIAGCSKTEQQSQQQQQTNTNKTVQYTCSMHPEVVQNSPGNCPKCGMKLVEKH